MPNIDQVQLPDGSQYNLKDNTSGYVTAGYVDDAIDALTKANVGLGNVDNTSDLNKPVSTAQQTALNGKTDTTVIAPTEATTTASRRYEIGEQFILNGVLYTATAVIASGDSIIVDTNCGASDSITKQLKDIASTYPSLTLLATQTGSAEKSVDLSDTDCDYVFVLEDNTGNAVKNIHIVHGSLIESTVKTIHSGAYFTSNDNEGYVIGYKKDSMKLYQYYRNSSVITSGCTLSVYKQK